MKKMQLFRSMRFTVGASLAALLMIFGAPSLVAAVEPGAAAPSWELRDVDGKTVKLSDFKDKVVVLDFWATWCPPCRKEIPGFVALQKQYGKDGLAIVGISLDQDGAAKVKKFIKANGMNYPVVMGNEDLSRDYGSIRAIPTTFVIDRAGKIVSKHVGYEDQAVFEKEIKPLLKP